MWWYFIDELKDGLGSLDDQLPPADSFDPTDTKNRRVMHVSDAINLICRI